MEMDGKLIIAAFGGCMVMCILFAGGGIALGAGISSFLNSASEVNTSSILFISSVILFALSAILYFKRPKCKM